MISDKSYNEAAAYLGCDVAAIKAVAEVEAKGSAFLADGKVKILFEPHIFWRELKAEGITPIESDICYEKWGAKPYGKYSEQWGRLERAKAINENAALRSASYGLFQILGKYYGECGQKSVKDFVNIMSTDEGGHLYLFTRLVKSRGLNKHLQSKDWAAFAKGYNGAEYKKNSYDTKLEAAYAKYS